MIPYYEDEWVTLYHGDCLEVMPTLSNVDLVVTSPPYNLGVTTGGGFGRYKPGQNKGGQGKWGGAGKDGITYTDHDDRMAPSEYSAWQTTCIQLAWDTLSESGAIFYNHKPRVQASTLWTPLSLVPEGIPVRQVIVWRRSGGINFSPTHYLPTHEWILLLAKPSFRLKSKGASGVGDVWEIAQETKNDHPAPFPLGIPARAIETTGPRLVLDPFAGSGTTLRAAKDAGIRAIGIEKSERYCEMTVKRLAQGVLL